jgi:hypothetical protein
MAGYSSQYLVRSGSSSCINEEFISDKMPLYFSKISLYQGLPLQGIQSLEGGITSYPTYLVKNVDIR